MTLLIRRKKIESDFDREVVKKLKALEEKKFKKK